VAGGCGAGWHRDLYGGSLKNDAKPAAHACPRGYHIGPTAGTGGKSSEGRPEHLARRLPACP
jgi:hypothetical protein